VLSVRAGKTWCVTEDEQEREPGQLALMPDLARARAGEAKTRAGRTPGTATRVEPAADRPVARVLVDVPLAHLDRPFDYLVPERVAESAVPGVRVKVRFAGQDVNGFVVERANSSEHGGRLSPLRRVVSAEPVLSPAIARLSRSVAARYAGTRSDVLRLAVPARHARVEKLQSPTPPEAAIDLETTQQPWQRYAGGPRFVQRLAEGESPRAVWSALPGAEWADALAQAVAATYSSGRGAVLCLPDRKDVAQLDRVLARVLGPGQHVVLTADLGPPDRYRAFLAVARGTVRVVVGTRAAAFAPVRDLGLVALWDDGDDLHSELHAPYPHAREVLLLRAHEESCAALVGGFARTVEAESLLQSGWVDELAASRDAVRRATARGSITGATDAELLRDPFARSARLPKAAFDVIREGLRSGPVLLSTPRQGYVTHLACDRCRTPARCTTCAGPLSLPGPAGPPTCGWCGVEEHSWSCVQCGGRGLRAPVLGDRRTAEEIGRAFPSVGVRTSSGERVLTSVDPRPAIVVATPGAEPIVEGGYACVVLLDTWLMLSRADLRTTEESLRRWLNAAALARPADQGGRLVIVGESSEPVLQALVRWDPSGFARRELADRQSAHLPPASRLATLIGDPDAVASALEMLQLPDAAETLGPVPVDPPLGRETHDPQVRVVVRVPRPLGPQLSRALVEVQGVRDAKKMTAVRVQVDPIGLA